MKFPMTSVLVLSVLAAGAAGRAGDEKTYAVEVISADATARTLTIRSDHGPASIAVEGQALAALERVKPGDTIDITVTGDGPARQVITAVVSGTVVSRGLEGRPTAEKAVMLKPAGTAVELINLDPSTRKVTVLGDRGLKRVFRVDEKAVLSLTDVRPGQKVLLSYRFDVAGKPEAVVQVKPATVLPNVKIERGTAFEVVSADPLAKAITVRREGGERETFMVDDRAAAELRGLDAGERVFITLENGNVAVITRTK